MALHPEHSKPPTDQPSEAQLTLKYLKAIHEQLKPIKTVADIWLTLLIIGVIVGLFVFIGTLAGMF